MQCPNRFYSDRFRGYYDHSRNAYNNNKFVENSHRVHGWDINSRLRHLSLLRVGRIPKWEYESILEILQYLITMLRKEYNYLNRYCHCVKERGIRNEKGFFRYDKYGNKYQNNQGNEEPVITQESKAKV